MQPKIKILYTEEEIKKRIAELASKITRDYAGREITLVGVLKGAFIFMADLARGIQLDTRCDFVRVSSYKDDKATGVVRMEFDVTQPIAGQDVILVEDIIDSGRTIEYLKKHLMQGKPRSLKICTLLYKDGNGLREEIDYIGFVVPKRYIVGYGLDSMGLCRNLPYIGYIEG
jgi:hypoxanthine phosphoribosyltransferase